MTRITESTSLMELAKTIRSTHAGPFRQTLDIMFDNRENYEKVKNSRVLTKEMIAKLYNINPKDVIGIFYLDPALGIKITFLNHNTIGASGDIGNPDVLGTAQYVPLTTLQIP